MCQFFSAIATRDGRLLFTEANHHETIIRRAKLRDTNAHVRHWVRVEVKPEGDGWGPVRVDETAVPAWWTEDAVAHEARVLALAARVRPARAAYKAVERPAWAAYRAVRDQAWDKAVQREALTAYGALLGQARAAYEAVQGQALAAYKAVQDQAWAACVSALRSIDGYVPEAEA